ncbi:hypothetical protein GOP47_0012157 [Adiantum capillus-veneris]|uniref:non-specific serine/threonine protein kinase n=1 Tax=Adiantum capillus-veneris TaxID=13818 RepID=A0A9D4UQE8_ADICA|nr:hypothetical protein GOP47_0012157 [Adiantum capillus-veneris]
MLWSSKMQLSSHKKAQHWKNESRFLQSRHFLRKDSSTHDTILVGMHSEVESIDLLLWTINIAATCGDRIIALYLNYNGSKVENLIGKLQTDNSQVAHTELKDLRKLCEAKKIQMDVKFALSGNEEVELIEESFVALATLLVVSPPSRYLLWNLQRKGGSLTRKAPAGCSVVFVKEFKVLFYKENISKDCKAGGSSFTDDIHLGIPILRSKSAHQPFSSLQRQFSCAASPLWSREEDESPHVDIRLSAGSKIWPIHTGECSPRGVLENHGLYSESELSSPSSTYNLLSHSFSRKGLLSCVSPRHEEDEALKERQPICTSRWRNGSIRRTSTFPPSSRMQKFSGPLDYTSVRNSLKSYVNTLWGTECASHVSPPTNGQQHCRCFLYEELAFATNYFNPENIVGKGGHAEVYKGTLSDGRIVAIKRLKKGGSEQVKEQDFLTELGIIGHVTHPNTTPLVGFCVEEGLHLIFDFSSHGSLATWLHGVNTPVLDWLARYKVAVGTARGLHYLHTGCPRRIIHRDIKASNILLGPDFEPQISDFGLAKWLPEQSSQLSVFPVEGTFGYLAPEYFMHGIIHEKTDVFAYGVLLLELITGRLPIDSYRQSLVIWAKPLLESSRIEELVDPRLKEAYDPQEMQSMVLAASLCLQSSAICRPSMGQVLDLLTDEHSESFNISFSHTDYFEDLGGEYNSSTYRNDLSRHREIALQF